ncbi:MAG: hypothetical protein DDG58_08190 [Ardenticatenia bacterium]|nr:MAG: hypothetical protein DDG58_08190 [Ardenticatenia bacterium]
MSALVQVGPHLLAVNHLKPYPTWQEFLPLIRKGFDAYCSVAHPKNIQRIGLRYVNCIEIPGEPVVLDEYLTFRPHVGAALLQNDGPFILGIQVPFEHGRDMLQLELTRAAAERPAVFTAILDLDCSLAKPGQVSLDSAFEWVQIAPRPHRGRF